MGELGVGSCLGINRSFSAYELKRIPRIGDVLIYIKSTPVNLHSLPSAIGQRRTLLSLLKNPLSKVAIRVKITKSLRPRVVLLLHFHVFNTTHMCPICTMVHALLAQLQLRSTPLRPHDFLFAFRHKKEFRPVSVRMVEMLLNKSCLRLS